jgi:hypothetical protein
MDRARSRHSSRVRHATPILGAASSVAAGDFNEDGKPDLVVADGLDGGAISVLLNRYPGP